MSWGIHPGITFDNALTIGQVVEARLESDGQPGRLRALITKLDKETAHIELLEDGGSTWPAGRGLDVPRFLSPLWSREVGLYPAVQS